MAPSKHVKNNKTEQGEKTPRKKDLSTIKNKIKRNDLYRKEKGLKDKEKRKRREKRKQERDALGNEAPPKQVHTTLENMRVRDETMVEMDDEEVLQDAATDEMASYFAGERVPKVLFTTCNRPKCHETMLFIENMLQIVPNSEYRHRNGVDLKKVIPQAVERGFTDLVVINEDQKKANALVISHLPNGPTAHFKLSSIRRTANIKNHGKTSLHRPELILNNFNTRLGHSVARYVFKNGKKTGLQELGPRFTLKLRSLQKGTFDTRFGEYEWIHKRKEMDTNRRKFHL